MRDINEELIERLIEECEDVATYERLSEEAEEKGYDMLATKLKSIAYDEFTHAFTIMTCLKRWGVEVGEKAEAAYEKARAIFKDM